MYIKRHAEKTAKKLSEIFGAVLVDPVQGEVGKTTMLEQITKGN